LKNIGKRGNLKELSVLKGEIKFAKKQQKPKMPLGIGEFTRFEGSK